MLRVDDGLVRADDRVDVLEEDDPGGDLVRPPDLLRLLLVLAVVAGRVEELPRDDGRAQPRAGERDAFAGLVRPAALEVLAHRRNVEDRDLVAVEYADAPLFSERDELHAAASARALAARRSTIRMSPLNGRITSQ